MFPDVLACFSVCPAALCQQIKDWCQLLFYLFTLKSKKTRMTPSGYSSINNQSLFLGGNDLFFAWVTKHTASSSPSPGVSP